MTTQTWIAGASGDWSTAANWVSGTVPGATDDVVINNLNFLTVNGMAVANSLTLDGGAQVTIGGTLTLGASLILVGQSGRFYLNGGTLSAQSLTLDRFNNIILSGYGTIHVTDPVSVFGSITAQGGTLKVDGPLAAGKDPAGEILLSYGVYLGATLELSNGSASSVLFSQSNYGFDFINGYVEQPVTLKLGTPAEFTGSLYGISVGDRIHLSGISVSSATFSGGALTFNETNGQQILYHYEGYNDYQADLSVVGASVVVDSDDNGGTVVYIASRPATEATTIRQQVAGLYAALYNRTADDAGMRYWVNVIAQQADAVDATLATAAQTPISENDAALLGQLFVSTQSSYFNQTYGHLSDADFVDALYLNMGGRHAETSNAITYWVNVIQNGEASGLSVENARAAMAGQFVHDLIEGDLADWTAALTPSELQTTVLRQAVLNNKLAVSLAYVDVSSTPAGMFLNANDVGDAAFHAQVTALSGMVITPLGASVMEDAIHRAVVDQNLEQIQLVGVLMPHPSL